jgi:deoxycytidine triphosphate deaminase
VIGHKYIKLFMKLGWIYCVPDPVAITENSIDVTLGDVFWRLVPEVGYILPDVISGAQFQREYPVQHPDGRNMIVVRPGEMLLAHTVEFIGTTVPFIVPRIRSRSTFARWTGEVITGAGEGEGNYHSRWVFEMHCTSCKPLVVKCGWRVGQVLFDFCIGGGMYRRQYNTPMSEWTPECMLPKRMD